VPITPDRTPGESDEEGLNLEDVGVDPVVVGGFRNNAGALKARDSIGVFNLRQPGTVPTPTAIGQVLFSVDGLNFSNELPLTGPDNNSAGWIVNDLGILLVVG